MPPRVHSDNYYNGQDFGFYADEEENSQDQGKGDHSKGYNYDDDCEDLLSSFRKVNHRPRSPALSHILPTSVSTAPPLAPASSSASLHHNKSRTKARAGNSWTSWTSQTSQAHCQEVQSDGPPEQHTASQELTTLSQAYTTPDYYSLRYYGLLTRAALKRTKIVLRTSLVTKNAFPECEASGEDIAKRLLQQVLEEAERDTQGGLSKEGKQLETRPLTRNLTNLF